MSQCRVVVVALAHQPPPPLSLPPCGTICSIGFYIYIYNLDITLTLAQISLWFPMRDFFSLSFLSYFAFYYYYFAAGITTAGRRISLPLVSDKVITSSLPYADCCWMLGTHQLCMAQYTKCCHRHPKALCLGVYTHSRIVNSIQSVIVVAPFLLHKGP